MSTTTGENEHMKSLAGVASEALEIGTNDMCLPMPYLGRIVYR